MSDETYNGWTNRETWSFQLHVTEYGFGSFLFRPEVLRALAEEGMRPTGWPEGTCRGAKFVVADALKDTYEMLSNERESYCGADSMDMFDYIGSPWRIDWLAVAPHWYGDEWNTTETIMREADEFGPVLVD